MTGRLDGKVAIVTGAAQGTGAAIARLFVGEGARVVLADVKDAQAESLAGELGARAAFVHLDVTRPDDWRAGVEQTIERFGGVDVLVNNAAILLLAPLTRISREDFLRIVGRRRKAQERQTSFCSEPDCHSAGADRLERTPNHVGGEPGIPRQVVQRPDPHLPQCLRQI